MKIYTVKLHRYRYPDLPPIAGSGHSRIGPYSRFVSTISALGTSYNIGFTHRLLVKQVDDGKRSVKDQICTFTWAPLNASLARTTSARRLSRPAHLRCQRYAATRYHRSQKTVQNGEQSHLKLKASTSDIRQSHTSSLMQSPRTQICSRRSTWAPSTSMSRNGCSSLMDW